MAKTLTAILCVSVSASCYADLRLLTFESPPLVNVLRQNTSPSTIQFTGFSVNLVNEVFKNTTIKYSMHSKPIKRALYDAIAKPNTCIFPIDRTQDRESQFKWVGPVAINRYAFYSAPNKHISINTLKDAQPYRLTAYAGTGIANYLEQRHFDLFETKSLEQGLQMLLSNRIELWVADTNAAKILTEDFNIKDLKPELVFLTSISFMACNVAVPDKEISDLNKQLKKMYQSGQAQDILRLED